MSHRSREKTLEGCEVGFTDKYKKTFEGIGRSLKDRSDSIRNFRQNYGKIDWSKK